MTFNLNSSNRVGDIMVFMSLYVLYRFLFKGIVGQNL